MSKNGRLSPPELKAYIDESIRISGNAGKSRPPTIRQEESAIFQSVLWSCFGRSARKAMESLGAR